MIDATAGNLIHVNRVTKMFPSPNGKPIVLRTLMRWILKGIEVNGRTIRLEARRVGSRWYTTAEAVNRFMEEQTSWELSHHGLDRSGGRHLGPEKRALSDDEIDAQLAADGI